MSKKKKEQLTSDGVYTFDDWSLGAMNVGTATVDGLDPGINYSYGDLDLQTSDMFEDELRKKYPALQDAYEHYQNIKRMCETREKEEDDN